jgi:hypothetical protein
LGLFALRGQMWHKDHAAGTATVPKVSNQSSAFLFQKREKRSFFSVFYTLSWLAWPKLKMF